MLSNPLPLLARPISTIDPASRTPAVGANNKASVRLNIVAAAPIHTHPVAHRLARDPEQARNLDLCAALADQPNRPPAKLLLSGLRQRTSVPIHNQNTTLNDHYLLRQVSKRRRTNPGGRGLGLERSVIAEH